MTDPMRDHKYKLFYDVRRPDNPEGATQAEIPAGIGAADALLIASLLRPPDGSLSVSFLNADPSTPDGRLDADEQFKVWVMLAANLAGQLREGGRKDLVTSVVQFVAEMLFGHDHDCGNPTCTLNKHNPVLNPPKGEPS